MAGKKAHKAVSRLLDAPVKTKKIESSVLPAKVSKKDLELQIRRYKKWGKFIDSAEKCGMNPEQWGEFVDGIAQAEVSLKGATDGRAIARRVTPFMVLEMARLAIQAKSETVRQSALKEVSYMGGAKPVDRLEVDDLSKMSVPQLDGIIMEMVQDVLKDAERTRLGRRTATEYIDAEVEDDGRGREAESGGAVAEAKEVDATPEDRLLSSPQGSTRLPQGHAEDEAPGGGKPVGEDNGGGD